MTNEVGIYRGSFDPPHKGHLETVTAALGAGMSTVTVIYKDVNPHKPFRSDDKTRKALLKTLFSETQNVIISNKDYKTSLASLVSDTRISRIYQIIGSDILSAKVWPIPQPTKLAYYIKPRLDFPMTLSITTWNNLPAKVKNPNELTEQHHSSTHLKALLYKQDFTAAEEGFPPKTFEEIKAKGLYSLTENERSLGPTLVEIKKIVEKEIASKKMISVKDYPLSFHLGKDIGISGISGDIVCFIKDKNKVNRLVVKLFHGVEHEKRYLSELAGYKTIEELDLKLIKIPKIHFTHRTDKYALLCMDFVSGKTLADKMKHDDEAIKLCARANLELHLAKRTSSPRPSLYAQAFYEEGLEIIQHKSQEYLIPSDLKEEILNLEERWNQLHSALQNNPGLTCYTHGDPNHSNCIVSDDNQFVYYIDLSHFQKSIDQQGQPCGFAIKELEESLITFWFAAKQKGGFTKEEVEAFKETYKIEYLSHAPKDLSTLEADRFFKSYWTLRVMQSLIEQWSTTESEVIKLKKEKQIQEQIQLFKQI